MAYDTIKQYVHTYFKERFSNICTKESILNNKEACLITNPINALKLRCTFNEESIETALYFVWENRACAWASPELNMLDYEEDYKNLTRADQIDLSYDIFNDVLEILKLYMLNPSIKDTEIIDKGSKVEYVDAIITIKLI